MAPLNWAVRRICLFFHYSNLHNVRNSLNILFFLILSKTVSLYECVDFDFSLYFICLSALWVYIKVRVQMNRLQVRQ